LLGDEAAEAPFVVENAVQAAAPAAARAIAIAAARTRTVVERRERERRVVVEGWVMSGLLFGTTGVVGGVSEPDPQPTPSHP
jgi:hypothetical protein